MRVTGTARTPLSRQTARLVHSSCSGKGAREDEEEGIGKDEEGEGKER